MESSWIYKLSSLQPYTMRQSADPCGKLQLFDKFTLRAPPIPVDDILNYMMDDQGLEPSISADQDHDDRV